MNFSPGLTASGRSRVTEISAAAAGATMLIRINATTRANGTVQAIFGDSVIFRVTSSYLRYYNPSGIAIPLLNLYEPIGMFGNKKLKIKKIRGV